MIQAYIGVGSNLNDPSGQIHRALEELNCFPRTRCVSHSSLYRSKPLGGLQQPDYLNAVVRLDTQLSATDLLERLLACEQQQGRCRTTMRWEPRCIDLDLLLYGQEIIRTENLIIPHQGLYTREFVLYPLVELEPDLILPTGESILFLKENCDARGLVRL